MRFFKDLEEAVTSEGIRIVILEVDGQPVASETQVIDRGIVYALRSDLRRTVGRQLSRYFLTDGNSKRAFR
jgi:hypothetical protein